MIYVTLNMLFVRRYCPNGAVYRDHLIPMILKFLVMYFQISHYARKLSDDPL